VERYPLWGWRRTPYIMLGLVLCAGGSALTPQAAYAIHDGVWWGVPLGFVAFGAWGFGFNFATVSYLSLATELSGTGQRARTVGVMWFVLILSMIIGGISLARSIEPYSHARLALAFEFIAGLAFGYRVIGTDWVGATLYGDAGRATDGDGGNLANGRSKPASAVLFCVSHVAIDCFAWSRCVA
jgi:BCD family chlorophyll transporter-like MFS transporter